MLLRGFQMRAVWSELVVAMPAAPSGDQATASTPPVWPVSWMRGWPVVAPQMRAVWSELVVAMQVPSGTRRRPAPGQRGR